MNGFLLSLILIIYDLRTLLPVKFIYASFMYKNKYAHFKQCNRHSQQMSKHVRAFYVDTDVKQNVH